MHDWIQAMSSVSVKSIWLQCLAEGFNVHKDFLAELTQPTFLFQISSHTFLLFLMSYLGSLM
jgi:hypothetical protein